jgi:hypothetical protein
MIYYTTALYTLLFSFCSYNTLSSRKKHFSFLSLIDHTVLHHGGKATTRRAFSEGDTLSLMGFRNTRNPDTRIMRIYESRSCGGGAKSRQRWQGKDRLYSFFFLAIIKSSHQNYPIVAIDMIVSKLDGIQNCPSLPARLVRCLFRMTTKSVASAQ